MLDCGTRVAEELGRKEMTARQCEGREGRKLKDLGKIADVRSVNLELKGCRSRPRDLWCYRCDR
jgi:hypothetical protein